MKSKSAVPSFELSLEKLEGIVKRLEGGAIVFFKKWKEAELHSFVTFGAGVMMGAAFLFMIPEAIELVGRNVGMGALIGFLVLYFLEKFMTVHPEESCDFHGIGTPTFVGFSFHNITDGIALGSSFMVPSLTPTVFLALISHHVPTSFAFASILKAGKYSRGKILGLLFVFTLMLPVGALGSHLLLQDMSPAILGWVIAISAGIFMHIAICGILPEVHKHHDRKLRTLVSFSLGLGLMVLLS